MFPGIFLRVLQLKVYASLVLFPLATKPSATVLWATRGYGSAFAERSIELRVLPVTFHSTVIYAEAFRQLETAGVISDRTIRNIEAR